MESTCEARFEMDDTCTFTIEQVAFRVASHFLAGAGLLIALSFV